MLKLKKTIVIILIFLILIAFIIASLYWYPRLFGSEEDKAGYGLQSIVYSYVTPKLEDPNDLKYYFFEPGCITHKNESLLLSLAISTGENITAVLTKIDSLCKDVNRFMESNSTLFDETSEVNISIKHWAEWNMSIFPKSNSIYIGSNHETPITDILQYCKGFESVNIGQYWGRGNLIPEGFNSSFFSDFDNLKFLTIEGFDPESETLLNDLAFDLNKKGVNVIIGKPT